MLSGALPAGGPAGAGSVWLFMIVGIWHQALLGGTQHTAKIFTFINMAFSTWFCSFFPRLQRFA